MKGRRLYIAGYQPLLCANLSARVVNSAFMKNASIELALTPAPKFYSPLHGALDLQVEPEATLTNEISAAFIASL